MGIAGAQARLLVWGLLVAAGGRREELATVTPEVPDPGWPESGAYTEPGTVMWLVPTEGRGQPSVRGERVEGPGRQQHLQPGSGPLAGSFWIQQLDTGPPAELSWLLACRMLTWGNAVGPCFPRPVTPAKPEGRVPRGL